MESVQVFIGGGEKTKKGKPKSSGILVHSSTYLWSRR